jgi:glycine dehydrogenase
MSEIAAVESGRFTIEASRLHAPHTVHDLVDANWTRKYSREEAVFPTGSARQDIYWCPVSRVDKVYGDRNLICTCPTEALYRM